MANTRSAAQQRNAKNTCTQKLAALVMIIFCIATSVLTITHSVGSVGWPHVAGAITESEANDDGGGWITYRYTVDDRTYSGHRVSYWINSSVASRYPVGSAVDVYYDPKAPAEAVLEPGLGRSMPWLLACLALPVVVVGLVVVWAWLQLAPSLLRLGQAVARHRQP